MSKIDELPLRYEDNPPDALERARRMAILQREDARRELEKARRANCEILELIPGKGGKDKARRC